MAANDSPKVVRPATMPADTDAVSLVPWTLAWIQAVEKQREAAAAQRGEQHAG